jgi:hypothetical protein
VVIVSSVHLGPKKFLPTGVTLCIPPEIGFGTADMYREYPPRLIEEFLKLGFGVIASPDMREIRCGIILA